MFEKIKRILAEKLNKDLLQQIERLTNTAVELQEELLIKIDLTNELQEQLQDQIKYSKDPKNVLNYLFSNNEVKWFDYEKLDHAEKIRYQQNARAALSNPVIKNEINFLTVNEAKKSLTESKKFTEVRNMRTAAVALQAFKNRLEEISPVEKQKTEEPKNPNSAI